MWDGAVIDLSLLGNVLILFIHSLRSLCAFLNSGKCGTVYLGIRQDGVVAGIRIDRKEVHLIS